MTAKKSEKNCWKGTVRVRLSEKHCNSSSSNLSSLIWKRIPVYRLRLSTLSGIGWLFMSS